MSQQSFVSYQEGKIRMGYSYSCVLSAQAFEVMWGWRRPCFVTNLTAIYLHIVLFSYKQAREQAHLHVKTGRFVKKKTRSLPASPLSKGQGTQRETVKWSSEFFTHSGSEEYHPQKLRIFLKRSQNWQNDFENADLSNLTLSLQTFNKKLGPRVLRGKFKIIGKREHLYVPHTYWYMEQLSLKQI